MQTVAYNLTLEGEFWLNQNRLKKENFREPPEYIYSVYYDGLPTIYVTEKG